MESSKSVLTTTASKPSYVTSPIGTLQLTVEECNDIMMKRAVVAAQQQQHQHQQQQQQQQIQQQQQQQHLSTITTADGHHAGSHQRNHFSIFVIVSNILTNLFFLYPYS